MCFSPEVDVAAGLVVGAVAVDALRHVRHRQELPLASLPALFAAHQFSEAFVWWDLSGRVPPSVGGVALWLYVLFAYVVLPVLVPAAVLGVEPEARRRRLLARLVVAGGAVAVVYLVAMLTDSIGVAVVGNRLDYDTGTGSGGPLAAVYVVMGCGALLASSHRPIVIFGVANAVAVAALIWLSVEELTSLWCLWAAVTSVAVAAHLRRSGGVVTRPRRPALALFNGRH